MNSKFNLILFPVIIISALVLMSAGYKLTESYKGLTNCLDALEDEKPYLLDSLAEIDTLNTRVLDDHWISAIAFRTREVDADEKEITFICHFEGDTSIAIGTLFA